MTEDYDNLRGTRFWIPSFPTWFDSNPLWLETWNDFNEEMEEKYGPPTIIIESTRSV
jgi:hypothetical protein